MTLAFLAAWLVPASVKAHSYEGPAFAPTCHATSGLDTTFERMVNSERWVCSDSDWRASDPVAWLKFDKATWDDDALPRFFYTRTARHSAIAIAALDADGTMRVEHYRENDGDPIAAGPKFTLDLPEIREETRAVLVRIERPHSIPLLTEARVSFDKSATGWSQRDMMLLALVLGMLVLPLLFDISFFVVLREKFVVLHAVLVIAMMIYVLSAGGLITVFVDLPVSALAIIAPLIWAIGMGIVLLFFAAFVEPGAQSPLMRRATIAIAWWTLLVPTFLSLQFHATQPFDDQGYFLAFVPAMIMIPVAVAQALWRGSMAARFIAVAWLPMIVAGFERFARGTGLYTGPSTLDQMLYFATAFEVIVISLAIAHRFLVLRRERDAALTEAETLERLSERDPLTGLMNRRAVLSRFEGLRDEGFDTFALIDLDKFKDVNDRFGHQVGDQALVACADAIRGGEGRDEVAVRLGGEEFVVLLRGSETLTRAEALRQGIAIRIARDVEGLDRVVTASMGVVEIPRDFNAMMDFDDLYARADKLLYEAKATGRNRTTYERLKVFRTPPAARPNLTGAEAA
ncbi:MAG: diguanylate cyclase [Erythrobacter sp.]